MTHFFFVSLLLKLFLKKQAAAGGVKKLHHFRPPSQAGAVALCEICCYQKSTEAYSQTPLSTTRSLNHSSLRFQGNA
jgi:hypothetical protein